MFARTFLAAALLPAALVACSKPAGDVDASSQPARADRELALTAPSANEAVASPIEVARPGTSEATSARQSLASRRQATRPAVEVPTPIPSIETTLSGPATSGTSPVVTDIPLIETAGSGPSVADADVGRASGPGAIPEPVERWPQPAERPGILIRGGRGGTDPCDIFHPRGRIGEGRGSVPPVLINPRVPTTGMPAAPRGGGAGGGGIRF